MLHNLDMLTQIVFDEPSGRAEEMCVTTYTKSLRISDLNVQRSRKRTEYRQYVPGLSCTWVIMTFAFRSLMI